MNKQRHSKKFSTIFLFPYLVIYSLRVFLLYFLCPFLGVKLYRRIETPKDLVSSLVELFDLYHRKNNECS